MSMIVHPDGKIDTETKLEGGLDQLQKIVGGYIQILACTGLQFQGCICNEEGKLMDMEDNPLATQMCGIRGDTLVGVVIFFEKGEVD